MFGKSPVFFPAQQPFQINKMGKYTGRNCRGAILVVKQVNERNKSNSLACPEIRIFLTIDQPSSAFNGMNDNGLAAVVNQVPYFLR